MRKKFLEVWDKRTNEYKFLQVPNGWTDEQYKSDIKKSYHWLEPKEIWEEQENGEHGKRALQLRS
jgi:hypothetical protein